MRRASWQLRRLIARLDPLAAGSVAAIAAAALLHYCVTLPGVDRLVQERAAQQQALARQAGERRAAAGRDPGAAEAARLIGALPAAETSSINGVLERMQAAADERKLPIETGSYQLTFDVANSIERYSITLPMRGNYPALRGFVRQVLAQSPNLALDGVSFNRAARADAVVDARLEFSAYFRRR